MTEPWLGIVGLGEDGVAGLTSAGRAWLSRAEVLVGGARHLALVGPDQCPRVCERLTWETPLSRTVAALAERRPAPTLVLATGDPMWFGIGVTLTRKFDRAEIELHPNLSAFQLAANHLGWALGEAICVTLHGRPVARLGRHLAPGTRILALTDDGQGPAVIARHLTDLGWGGTRLAVLEQLGGPRFASKSGTAVTWGDIRCADLNIVAIEAMPDPGTPVWPLVPGLPDAAFVHDGQLTKRWIRALTLTALAPLPGQRLWDVGAGAGSVAIEWLRANESGEAVAIEADPARADTAAANAARLGVPELKLLIGKAPEALTGLPRPDTVFIGGGVSEPGLLDACWNALPTGGRLVANAVTIEGEAILSQFALARDGELTRHHVEAAAPLGGFQGWKPAMPVTQAVMIKQ